MAKPRLPREHGTVRGYHQHDTNREVACGACLAALARREERKRHKGRCERGTGWPMLSAREANRDG